MFVTRKKTKKKNVIVNYFSLTKIKTFNLTAWSNLQSNGQWYSPALFLLRQIKALRQKSCKLLRLLSQLAIRILYEKEIVNIPEMFVTTQVTQALW